MELVEASKDLRLARLGEPLSLRSLAGELNVSPYHLTRVFRELTGRTLTTQLHDLRLRAAVDRLGEESLSQIAADLGYRSDEGGPAAGKIELYSGATGAKLRTITSTTAGENLGFDAVGVGDVNRDHRPDLLGSAAEGDTVYMIAGDRRR